MDKGTNSAETPTMIPSGSETRRREVNMNSKVLEEGVDENGEMSLDYFLRNEKDLPNKPWGMNKGTSSFDRGININREATSRASRQTIENSNSTKNKGKKIATSPEKEERYPRYITRRSLALDRTAKSLRDYYFEDKGGPDFPKIKLALSKKEIEEDFKAIGCSELLQWPKTRPKSIQKALDLVTPGTNLPNVRPNRYEVKEKKVPKKG